jgi:hypothetical protein
MAMKTALLSRCFGLMLATLTATIAGCSAQPMTLNQELVAVGVAGAVGATSGALFAAAAHKDYPASMGIGAGGMAGAVLIYEEVKREAALESQPPPPPIDNGPSSSSTPNP